MKTMLRATLLALSAIVVLQAAPAARAAGTGVIPDTAGIEGWRAQAAATTITRDDWGIAHVHGHTDAQAVFGMAYAQAEDDFNRIESNYLDALGRRAEAEGEPAIWQDLRAKLFIDPAQLRALYAGSPAWLKALMNAWADGLNYYLHTHPAVKPRVITRFEPWMALSFSEGSIGGDIERVKLAPLKAFYDGDGAGGSMPAAAVTSGTPDLRLAAVFDGTPEEPGGSNGIAIAPANTLNHHALLLINPHTSFFFRSELQVASDAGLDAYGAVTWGQFFLYQGFNQRLGWMHTSSTVDNVDWFREDVVRRDGRLFYRYGAQLRPVQVRQIQVPYRAADGSRAVRTFTTYSTHHGPVVESADGRWTSIALMFRPVQALEQGFLLTKARNWQAFMKAMRLQANSSNNTVYADADGNIAYLHPQFVPRRDDHFDYTRPVDGSDPATDWRGLHTLDEVPHLFNPPNGWIMNTNDGPYSAAGAYSPKQSDFPKYMDTVGENPRGIHATRLLQGRTDFTLEGLRAAAFDSYLPAMAQLVPGLVGAWDGLPAGDALKDALAAQVAQLRGWDFRWSADSVATTLAALWGDGLWSQVESQAQAQAAHMSVYDYMDKRTDARQKLQALAGVCSRLEQDFGHWQVPWGEFNRYQRLTGDIIQPFTDAGPSLPVPFTSSRWGSLASFGARRYDGTNRYYGTSGNSFVAVVEFGPTIRARAVSTGGESGDPSSPHFADQALRYTQGNLREVYFYPAQLRDHTLSTYHPGAAGHD